MCVCVCVRVPVSVCVCVFLFFIDPRCVVKQIEARKKSWHQSISFSLLRTDVYIIIENQRFRETMASYAGLSSLNLFLQASSRHDILKCFDLVFISRTQSCTVREATLSSHSLTSDDFSRVWKRFGY
jgi:hypothetical protein